MRLTRVARAVRRLAPELAGVVLLAGAAGAQDPPRPRIHPDSIPVDTVMETRKPPTVTGLARNMAATIAYVIVAPFATSGLLFFPTHALQPLPADSAERASPANTVHTWASAGTGPGVGARRRADWSGTAAVGLEVLTHGVLVDARWEHAWMPERVELRTAHVGWLAHPRRGLMGGVVVGYREARGRGVPSGVELGFPLLLEAKGGGWMRFEPSYVIGRREDGFVMSYRIVVAPSRSAHRLVPAVVVQGRGLARNDGFVAVSARYGMRQALR